jgi:hypothetical protein
MRVGILGSGLMGGKLYAGSELFAAYGSNHNKYIGRTKMKLLTVPIISLSLLSSACNDAKPDKSIRLGRS